jgi:hypothetical protein
VVLQTGRLSEYRQRQSSVVSATYVSCFQASLLTWITEWTIIAGPIARLVHPWGELTLYMALSTISYYSLVELQTSLRRTESESSGKWHCRVANGYLLLA